MRGSYLAMIFALMYQSSIHDTSKPVQPPLKGNLPIGGGWRNNSKCFLYYVRKKQRSRKRNKRAKQSRRANRRKK